MDGPQVDPLDHEHALRSLNRINRFLGVDRQLAACLAAVGAADDASVLDLGCGGGGFLGFLHDRTARVHAKGLVGLDRSTFALKCASRWQSTDIHWVSADARNLPLADDSFDVVTCSLFLHHFDEDVVVAILKEASRVARRGIVIGDLSRSWPAWAITWIMTRVLSRSWIFHVDGPRSVRAAFRADEMLELARRAGLGGAIVEKRFPFRLSLTWRR